MNNPNITVDIGVVDAWAMGLTGEGITVSFIDDGVEMTHPDLAEGEQGREEKFVLFELVRE